MARSSKRWTSPHNHQAMAPPLHSDRAAQLIELPTIVTGGHHPNGPKADDGLTFQLEYSVGRINCPFPERHHKS